MTGGAQAKPSEVAPRVVHRSDEGPHSEELRTTGHSWDREKGRCRVCGTRRDTAGWAEDCPAIATDPVTARVGFTVDPLPGSEPRW